MSDTATEPSNDSAGLVAQAERCLESEDYAGAEQFCDQVLSRDPTYNRAHVIKARAMMPGLRYDQILNHVHWHLKPDTYVEIGVATGASLARVPAETRAVAIDPAPRISRPIKARARLYPIESDTFFERYDLFEELGAERVSVAFIDGLHLFEQALRDFINIEKYAQADTITLIHDCYPATELSAQRESATDYWCGDVWRLIPLLRKYRPDLNITVAPAFPSGLGIITGMDASSTALSERYDEIVAEGHSMSYPTDRSRREQLLPTITSSWDDILQFIQR